MAKSPEGKPLKRTVTEHVVGTQSILHLLQDVLGDASDAPPLRPDGSADAPPVVGSSPPEDKYEVASEIGRGGMGSVLKAYDNDLRRWVAMKVVREDIGQNVDKLSRFVEEAQVCGQLEHPNIPPVHEMGVQADGRVFFTMKLVKGRTLREIARDLALGRPDVRREFTPIRIAQTLQQAAMGVHYANVRGVLHRDLKPENIMVGDYGEVLVMDWGLAKVIDAPSDPDLSGEDPVLTARTESGISTLAGAVQGTPSYISPEAARGEIDSLDSRADVFGLGGVLYECLCFRPPFVGRNVMEILDLARRGEVAAPSDVAPGARIPPVLEAICMKALSADRSERHADAREFQSDLQSYIEGTRDRERRRNEALELVSESRTLLREYDTLEEKRARLREQAESTSAVIAAHDDVEKKKLLWRIEDAIQKLEMDGTRLSSRAVASLNAALQTDPDCEEARGALADLYWQWFVRAEEERRARDAAVYRDLVEAHDDGRYAEKLKGDGSLAVETDPPGGTAVLHRYEEKGRVLTPIEVRSLGETPVAELSLPMGSYLVTIRKDGFRDTSVPVVIGRSESKSISVTLRTEREIGEGFLYIPAGEVTCGGDPESYGGAASTSVYVDDVYVARFPVTLGEYCEFLDALGDDAEEHVPRQANEVFVERDAGGKHRPVEGLVEGDVRTRYAAGFELSCPVFGVSWHSAVAYAEWRSKRDDRRYELPTEDAWEKAARGADGRFHPWGDRFEWTFAKGGLSRPELAQPEPVGAFAEDVSPYGVRDLAGTIREWTQSWFDEKSGTRALRGGSWNLVAARHFRAATRFGYVPTARSSTFGFRLVSRECANK